MKNLIYVLLFFIATSCNSRNEEITKLETSKYLKVKESKIIPDGCFVEAFVYDSLLVLVSICDSTNFQVYNRYSLKLIRKFGEKGKSPFEFHTSLPYRSNSTVNVNDSLLYFYDLNLVREQKINLGKIAAGFKPFESITSKSLDINLAFSNDLGFLEGNKVVGRGIDDSKGLFFIYDQNSEMKKWVDYLPKIKMNNEYKLLSYYGYLWSNSNRIVYAARYFDEVLFFDSDGHIIKEHYFSKVVKPILSKEFSGVSGESKLFAMKAYGTNDFCYILRVARPGNDFQQNQNKPSQILVFDWKGNLVNVYQHSSYPTCFCVDKDSQTMYCVTKYNDPNNITLEKIIL